MDKKELLTEIPETKLFLESLFLESDIDNVLKFLSALVSDRKIPEVIFEFPVVFNQNILMRMFSSYITALNGFERPVKIMKIRNCVFVFLMEAPLETSFIFKIQEPIRNFNSQLIVSEIPSFKKIIKE